jgi:hypothetical protein
MAVVAEAYNTNEQKQQHPQQQQLAEVLQQ